MIEMKLSICLKCQEIEKNYISLHAVKIDRFYLPNVFNFNKNLKVPLFEDGDIFFSIFSFICREDHFIDRQEFEYLDDKYIEGQLSSYWIEKCFFLFYELGIIEYFIVKTSEEIKSFFDVNIDKKGELFFHKTVKSLNSKTKNQLLTGLNIFFKEKYMVDSLTCPYFLEHLVLQEDKNVL